MNPIRNIRRFWIGLAAVVTLPIWLPILLMALLGGIIEEEFGR